MAKKPLRSQLNQIRAWVREGRTDAWIAHQLELPAAELREFKRRHGLTADGGDDTARTCATRSRPRSRPRRARPRRPRSRGADRAEAERGATPTARRPSRRRPAREPRRGPSAGAAGAAAGAAGAAGAREDDRGDVRPRRRRTGFGLWLDPAVQDEAVYSENWAGHRELEVTIEPDRIVIRRRAATGRRDDEPRKPRTSPPSRR